MTHPKTGARFDLATIDLASVLPWAQSLGMKLVLESRR